MNATSRTTVILLLPVRIIAARSRAPATKDTLEMALSVNQLFLQVRNFRVALVSFIR